MLNQLYAYAIAAAIALGSGWLYGHMQYEKGFTASRTEQTAVILKYQQVVVEKEQKRTEEVAKLATEHAAEIATIRATKPVVQEKIRVITKTIDRPAACNLQPSELQLINEAVHSSNGGK